ncbi:uncharacterized protein C8R40DRAFT_1067155 [Lentinula edodes]|uniref:uncharacterized protein n=1 Tax=Lentinula edodes TaxID=5353 RepID=UPI001E8EB8B9|nr:uncharacterized protein C8R40DRAFT_1067155 [Lentinula edodes]KAH7878770.1 hypothetical protein C8R40DRAFT_1067155 [Lentinula edodes]
MPAWGIQLSFCPLAEDLSGSLSRHRVCKPESSNKSDTRTRDSNIVSDVQRILPVLDNDQRSRSFFSAARARSLRMNQSDRSPDLFFTRTSEDTYGYSGSEKSFPDESCPLVGSSVALQILHLASKLAASFTNTATSVARLFCSTLLKIHDQPTIAIRYTTACPVRFTKITQRIVSRWARISLRLRRIRSSLENRDDQQLQSAESRMGSASKDLASSAHNSFYDKVVGVTSRNSSSLENGDAFGEGRFGQCLCALDLHKVIMRKALELPANNQELLEISRPIEDC